MFESGGEDAPAPTAAAAALFGLPFAPPALRL